MFARFFYLWINKNPMEKEKVFGYIVLPALSVAFVVISFLLFINPKNARLLKRKLHLGAAIIALTSISLTFQSCVTCYEPAQELPPNEFFLNTENDSINILLNETNKITGYISNPVASGFYYRIIRDELIYQSGKIEALDGAYNSDMEDFEITLNDSLYGLYDLLFYSGRPDEYSYDAKYVLNILEIK